MIISKNRFSVCAVAFSLLAYSSSCNLPLKNVTQHNVPVTVDVIETTGLNANQMGIYSIRNGAVKAQFTNYGARLVALWVPNKDGKPTDVVLGFRSVKEYVESSEPYFGAVVGRFGNRIAKGQFELRGKRYQLTINNGPNTLHGGKKGFHKAVWNVEQPDSTKLIFTYFSKDGEEGFPGNLAARVTYAITSKGALKMEYEAITDQATVINLTNHAFFNLNGEGSGKILDHKLTIFANKYTPVDSTLIPTGQLATVKGTPFDFTKGQAIGARIRLPNEQLKNGKGYDHNFVITSPKKKGMRHAASVVGDMSGIKMDIYTTEPGLQFYSGNFMRGKNTMKNGAKDTFRSAFAMETQHFPDSPNQSSFPTTVLNPGKKYHTVSIYQFSISKSLIDN